MAARGCAHPATGYWASERDSRLSLVAISYVFVVDWIDGSIVVLALYEKTRGAKVELHLV